MTLCTGLHRRWPIGRPNRLSDEEHQQRRQQANFPLFVGAMIAWGERAVRTLRACSKGSRGQDAGGAPQWGQSLPCSDEKTILSSSCLPIGSVLPGFFRVRCDEAVHAVRSENRRRWSTMMQRSWITVIPASRSFWADGPWWIPSWVQTARGRGERARISST